MITLYCCIKKLYKKGYIGMNMLKRKKITIVSIAIILLVIITLIIAINVSKKEKKPQEEMLTTVRIQGDNASLNGVVIALDGEVITDEENADTTTFRAEDQEIIITLDSDVAIVNGEETAFVKTTAVVEEIVVDEDEAEIEEVKQPITYIDNDEVFVPIEFVEDVFDLEFDDETLEFKRDDEVIIGGEAEELPEVEVIEEPQEEDVKDDIEEDSEDEEIDAEPSKEESDKVETETGNNNTNTGATNTSSNSTTSSSSNSSSNSSSGGGATSSNTSSGSSNNNTTTSTPTTTPTHPETTPPVINASSVSVDKTSVTLEVGGSTKVSAWVSPDNTTNKGIAWSSENTSVATVDSNGNITAKTAGSTRIVATASSNGSAKAYINVTVNAPKPPVQPTYTGSSVIAQLKNEGWYTVSDVEVYFHKDGDGWSSSFYQVYVAAYNGSSGIDVRLWVKNIDSVVFNKAQQALAKIIPSGASTIINNLQTPGYSGGTYTFDGRKVEVYFVQGKAYIDIYGKQ